MNKNSMQLEEADVIILGAGPAGLKAGQVLLSLGYSILILEKESRPGGKLLLWDSLFPFSEDPALILAPALDVVEPYIRTSVGICSWIRSGHFHCITDETGKNYSSSVLIIATGFQPFDAKIKEEYGYGIYENVITSVDLEMMFRSGKVLTSKGLPPERVAMIHCVGSRDIKVGNEYCSSVCCITGIKQGIKLSQSLPGLRVSHLYMDLRLGGRFYEDCYKKAQMEHRIQFIRGRLSETNPNRDGSLVIRYEDTLAGKPAKLTVDLLVLLVGMVPDPLPFPAGHLTTGSDGFYGDGMIGKEQKPSLPAVLYAGACTGPKNLTQAMQEAVAVAWDAAGYLSPLHENLSKQNRHGIRV